MKLASCLNKLADLFTPEERAAIIAAAQSGGAVQYVQDELSVARAELERVMRDIAKAQGAKREIREPEKTPEPGPMTHAPAVDIHAKANPPIELDVNEWLRSRSSVSYTVRDRYNGSKASEKQLRAISAMIAEARRLGLPEAALDGIRSFYLRDGMYSAEYAIESQSIGITPDVLDAQLAGREHWARVNVGNLIHEIGHHITGNESGESFVGGADTFAVMFDANGYRQPVGVVMREAWEAYDRGGDIGAFLRYPLRDRQANVPAHGLKNQVAQQETSLMLQEEVFAQSWALYFTNPAVLRKEMPNTYQLMEGVANAVRSAREIGRARRAVLEHLRTWRPEVGTAVGRGTRQDPRGGDRVGEAGTGMEGRRGVVDQASAGRRLEHRYAVAEGRETAGSAELRGAGLRDGGDRPVQQGQQGRALAPVRRGSLAGEPVSIRARQPDAVTIVGVHYSPTAGLDRLRGSMYGASVSRFGGEEYGRVATSDVRIRRRVYFYAQTTDRVPRPEPIVGGQHVYTATLANILDAESRTAAELFKKAGRDVNGNLNANEFERLVVDAGYDGYFNPSFGRDGAVVVLDADVPVRYVGTRQDVRGLALESRSELDRNSATLSDFRNGRLKGLLRKKNWAIITAENPGARTLPEELNARRNARLERDLKRMGLAYEKIVGKYGGNDEHSFIVVGIRQEQAHELRDKYQQDSVLTREGLEYADGSITPATGVTEHETTPGDFYSRIPSSGASFTVDLDFDARTAPTKVPDDIAKHLTPEEINALGEGRGRVKRLLDVMKELPAQRDFEHAALSGRAAKGWYQRSRAAIEENYGADAPRFIALMAALSPQTDVQSNFYNTALVWHAWDRAARTTDPTRIKRILTQQLVTGRGQESGKNAMEAWAQNSIRVLTTSTPERITLSGPKVESFRRNLMGDLYEVTNDRHNAAFAGIEASLFNGVRTKASGLSTKGPGYMAFSVRLRQAAAALTRTTGEEWTPAEAQETMWSFWKALYDLASAAGETRSAVQLIRDGELTHEMVRRVPDLGSFIHEERYQKIAGTAGQEPARVAGRQATAEQGAPREAGPIAATPAIERIARRADKLIAKRAEEERLTREKKRQQEEAAADIGDAQESPVDDVELDDIPGFDDPPKRGGKLESRGELAAEPLWYSRLAQAMEKAPWSKAGEMPVGQLRMWIAARAKDGTLPAEEVKWSGIDEMLASRSDRVSRSDIDAFLKQNGVRVEEVILAGSAEYNFVGNEWQQAIDRAEADGNFDEAERIQQAWEGLSPDTGSTAGQPKFAEYQLPGGENYHELLLKLPPAGEATYTFVVHQGGRRSFRFNGVDYPTREEAAAAESAARNSEFRSTHFADQPNTLAHVRFNERSMADGKRVLFIEEIQSDWAQKGRKNGFGAQERYVVYHDDARQATVRTMAEAEEMLKRNPYYNRIESEKLDRYGIPDAPFVTRTEAWVALVMKRMVRYAADNGFDAVAWTTGEQQTDRYDLSAQIRELRWTLHGIGAEEHKVSLSATHAEGGTFDSGAFGNLHRPEALDDVVGKEMATKIRDKISIGERKGSFSGIDLKVGGEGMRSFYDRIVPNVVNDLLKKMGGGKVTKIAVEDGSDVQPAIYGRSIDGFRAELISERGKVLASASGFKTWEDANSWLKKKNAERMMSQPGFFLTDAIRPKASRAQALFSKGELGARDVTETPEFKAWFGDSKVVDENGDPLVVYHGSETAFDTFKFGEEGFHFGTKEQASTMGGVVRPFYLSAKKLFSFDDDLQNWNDIEAAASYLLSKGRLSRIEFDSFDGVQEWLSKNGYDGFTYPNSYEGGGKSYSVFSPTQIKSAIGNRGTFDPKRPSILESRSELAERAQNLVSDVLTTQKSFNLWDRTVGTQFHKAAKDADFKPVYDGVQSYLNDASTLMMGAADLAPDVLPKLEGLKGILGVTASKADLNAMSAAIFDGTLEDVVYTDAQLGARGMSAKAIELYRQTRAAIDRSLTDVMVSEAVKQAKGILPDTVLAQAREEGDPWVVVNALSEAPVDERSAVHQQVYDQLRERVARIEELKQQGYAPLMRFGRYTVSVQGEGETKSFTMHESEAEANAVARAMRSAYPPHWVKQGILSEDAWQLFQGVSPDTLEVFAESVGASEKQVFQEYLKLATNNRSTLRRLIRRKKIAGFSVDAQRALAQFVTSNGRAASRNYHWGDVLKAANAVPKEKGDVKDEAVRLAKYVQHPTEEAGALRGLLFVQFLGGSVASALTNATQPVLMSFPYLARFGAAKAAAALAGAARIAVGGRAPEADLRESMQRATNEGIISPHEVAGLYAESIRNLGSNLAIRRVLRAWGSLFSLAEAFNRRLTFAAAYRLARDAGEADPYGVAVKAIAETQGVYNRGNRPNWARGAVGATLFTFKQYSVAYVEFLTRLPARQKALALAVLVMAAGLNGVPGADDLEDVVDTIAESLGYSFNSKKAMRQWAIRTLGESAGPLLTEGFSGLPGVPVDVQARLGLGNLIPGTGILKRSSQDKGRDVLEFFGPAGSQAKAFVEAVGAAQEGNVGQIAKSGLPLAVQNALKAVDMVSTGYYRDDRGRRVIDVDTYEAMIKGLGVQPKRVGEIQRRRSDLQQDVALQREVESEISDLWARGIVEKDPEKVSRARAKLLDWNLTNPESRIVVTPLQVQKRVQQAMLTAEQRFIKATPPELRARVAEELRQ